MIIVDPNVLSALMRKTPDPAALEWFAQQPAESIWITSIMHFEARLGLALLRKGRRRSALESAFEELQVEDLEGRILDSDRAAAAAALSAERQRQGRTVDIRDTQIAGVVLARRATFATRNVKHFSDLGADIINPWESP